MAPTLTLIIKPEDAATIGDRLRIARGKRSQQAMADMIGVSARTLRNWERNAHSPTVEGVKAVAKHTGFPAMWLFDINDEGRTPDGDPADSLTLCAPWDLNPEPADSRQRTPEILRLRAA